MGKFTLNLDGPFRTAPKQLTETSFDYSGRYRIIAEVIQRYFDKQPGRPKNILDVGGLGGPLHRLLPNIPLTIYDNEAADTAEQKKGDGAHMVDIADGAFDVVVTSDTLEHIPRPDRKDFVNELIRASNDLVILCAPFADHGAADEEAALQTTYQHFAGHKHRWLAEHEEYGLPRIKEIQSYFAAHTLSTVVIGQSSLALWRSFMAMNLLANDVDDDGVRAAIAAVNRYYNTALLERDFSEDSYRTFIIASKQTELAYKPPSKPLDLNDASQVIAVMNDFYGQLMHAAPQIPRNQIERQTLVQTQRELESRLGELTNQYYGIVNSKTWQYTEPVRQLNRLRHPSKSSRRNK